MQKIIFPALAILIFLSSCEKSFLKEEPRSVLNPTNFYVDEAGLNAGVNAAYASLRPIYGESEMPFRLTLLGTDLFTYGKGVLGVPFNIYNPDLNSNAAETTEIWANLYKMINVANNVINSAPAVQMDAGRKDRLVSECLFIRALSYYWLAQQFGAVPLRLEATAGVITEATRVAPADIYKQMVTDLQSAETKLAITYPQNGRITKGAVQFLLSKFFLLQKDWANAELYAKKVITEDGYRLEPVFYDVFLSTNQLNKEIIFSVQYENDPANSGTVGNQTHLYFQNSYSDIPGMMRVLMWGRPFSRFAPTPYLMSLFDDAKDSRTDIWRMFDDYYYNNPAALPAGKKLGDPIDESWRGKIEFHWALLKYWDPTRPNVNEARGNKDYIVFRLAEAHLIAAEALMMQGKQAEGITYFNAIRRRAARSGINMDITAAQLNINAILDERARELAGELDRWFDLVRTGTAKERIIAYSALGQGIKDFHLLRPIPQNEIDRLSTPIAQNPGY